MNVVRPGMRIVLRAIAASPEGTRFDAGFLENLRPQIVECGGDVGEIMLDRFRMYPALRTVTTEEAKGIWDGTFSGDAFEGWHRLCRHFQPNVNAQSTEAAM